MKILVLAVIFLAPVTGVRAQDYPCVKLIQACKVAGFAWNKNKSKKLGSKETQLKIDCLDKLVEGGPQAVPEVTEITQFEIDACKTFQQQKKALVP